MTGAAAEGSEGVGGLHRSGDVGERSGARTRPSKGGPCWCEPELGKHGRRIDGGIHVNVTAQGSGTSAKGARRTVPLTGASDRGAGAGACLSSSACRRGGGGGRVSKEDYGQELEANLVELHKRLKAKRYRHQPLRRVHIPKGGGRTRPIGISAVEDKVVQGALPRGAGGGVRARFSGMLVWLPAWTQCPRCDSCAEPSGVPGQGELDSGG